MKRTLLLLALCRLVVPAGAGVIVSYGTAGNVTSLAAAYSAPEVSPAALTAGAGLKVQDFLTFNFTDWDPASVSFNDAVAADDQWTWGFTVAASSLDLTTMDIRLDHSGTGPDDFEIQAVVTPSGGSAGAPVSLLTHDYADSASEVTFVDVDLSGIPTLATGDTVVFTLAAFNSEAADGTFDLETLPGSSDAIIINGNIAGALPNLGVILDRTIAFENEAGGQVFLAVVSRSGDTTDPVTVAVTNPDTTELEVPASVDLEAGMADGVLFFDVKDDPDLDGAQVVTLELSAPGYNGTTAAVTVLDDDSPTDDIVLNEALINTTGTDTEFFEIYNSTGATVDIQGWSVVVYGSDSGETGRVVATVAIPSGAAVDLAPGGFYLIGDDAFVAAFPSASPDLQVPAIGTLGGSQTVAVFDSAGNLVYSVLFDDGDGEANVGGAPVTADAMIGPDGSFLPAGFRFVADGGGYAELLEFSPVPAPSATPGATNVLPPALILTLAPAAVSETDGSVAALGTVTRTHADPGSPLTVALSDDDADDSEISIPGSVTIPAGETTATFGIDALDDVIPDGAQNVTITATAAGYAEGISMISVGDNETTFPAIVINEIWADDASGDSAEYVELFGPAGAALSGLSLIVVDGDTGGSTAASQYRKVIAQIDFATETIPSDGYFVIGGGDATPNVDYSVSLGSSGWLQNGSQTYALVPTVEIVVNGEQLTQESVDAISLSVLDLVAVLDGGAGDDSYFGAPEVSGNIDLIARNGDGVDTDTGADWNTQSNSALELGDPGDTLSSAGTENLVITPPVVADLLITASSFDFLNNEVTVRVAGMQAGATYSLDHSTDLDQADAWESIGGFGTDFGATETAPGSGIYEVTVGDAELGTELRNFYRVSGQ